MSKPRSRGVGSPMRPAMPFVTREELRRLERTLLRARREKKPNHPTRRPAC